MTGGQAVGPHSEHSKAFTVRTTFCQVLAWVTTKLKPYWLSVPPPLPTKVTPCQRKAARAILGLLALQRKVTGATVERTSNEIMVIQLPRLM